MNITFYNNPYLNPSYTAFQGRRSLPVPRETIEIYLKEGKSVKEIAESCKMSISNMYKVLNELKLPSPNEIRYNRLKEEGVELLKQNATQQEIAQKTGTGMTTVYNWIKDFQPSATRAGKKERYRELFKKGLSDEEIAKELNISPTTANGMRYKLGFNQQDTGIKQQKMYDKLNLILSEQKNGLSVQEICEKHNIGQTRAYYLLKNAGKILKAQERSN